MRPLPFMWTQNLYLSWNIKIYILKSLLSSEQTFSCIAVSVVNGMNMRQTEIPYGIYNMNQKNPTL